MLFLIEYFSFFTNLANRIYKQIAAADKPAQSPIHIPTAFKSVYLHK
jgi:hypothetical protein